MISSTKERKNGTWETSSIPFLKRRTMQKNKIVVVTVMKVFDENRTTTSTAEELKSINIYAIALP
jgi:hypothetical protein